MTHRTRSIGQRAASPVTWAIQPARLSDGLQEPVVLRLPVGVLQGPERMRHPLSRIHIWARQVVRGVGLRSACQSACCDVDCYAACATAAWLHLEALLGPYSCWCMAGVGRGPNRIQACAPSTCRRCANGAAGCSGTPPGPAWPAPGTSYITFMLGCSCAVTTACRAGMPTLCSSAVV